MDDETPTKPRLARNIWAVCVLLLLAPSLLVWIVRGAALAARCVPGPGLCRGIALGGALHDALMLAWSLGTATPAVIAVALLAGIAALFARRPLLAALTMLLLPLAVLILPMAAVYTTPLDGCTINEAGIGDCTLWGAQMGMGFHTAVGVPWLIYGFAPYSFSLALMLGMIGWFLVRVRPLGHASAHHPHRFPDDRFTHRQ